jgi:uncharacterized phage protein gp47/JayE
MPFQRPGLQEIVARVEGVTASRLGLGQLLRRSILRAWARLVAGATHLFHGHLDWIARQAMVDTAELEHLNRHASIYQINRKAAEFASGTVALVGNDGAEIPEGTLLQRADGMRYLTTADAEISAGGATVEVQAELAGAAANEDAEVTLSLVSPISGVNSTGTILAGGLAGGADEETDEALRARVLARIREKPQGGAAHDYEAWTLEVAGVTRVWVLPGWMGAGSVGVTFVKDADPSTIFPAEQDLQDVRDHLEPLRPVTADVVVFAPTAKLLQPTIALAPNSIAARDAVEAAIVALLQREAEPGGTLHLSRLSEAISLAAGESSHVLVAPVADVVSQPHELLVLDSITWQ